MKQNRSLEPDPHTCEPGLNIRPSWEKQGLFVQEYGGKLGVRLEAKIKFGLLCIKINSMLIRDLRIKSKR